MAGAACVFGCRSSVRALSTPNTRTPRLTVPQELSACRQPENKIISELQVPFAGLKKHGLHCSLMNNDRLDRLRKLLKLPASTIAVAALQAVSPEPCLGSGPLPWHQLMQGNRYSQPISRSLPVVWG